MAEPQLTVDEASETYANAMRNVQPAGIGICTVCKTFIPAGYPRCIPCNQSIGPLSSIAPITYSEHGAQMHTALRQYKESSDAAVRSYATVRLTAILWRFLEAHEICVARDIDLDAFDVVCVVPSSTPADDNARGQLRQILEWCAPVKDRYTRLLKPTGQVPASRDYDPNRFACTENLHGQAVLLIDDTWTSGGHAQSAAVALVAGGAHAVGCVVIGRHLRREWRVTPGEEKTSGQMLDALPRVFDWDTCAVH